MLEFTARKNLNLKLTSRQTEILIGCLLGDAYIHPLGKIQIEQSIKQLPYLNWKYEELRSLAYSPPTKVERFDSRYKKIYVGARFWLRQYFRPLRKTFYPEGKKIFPKEISKHITELSLAVWYMDDGNLYNRKHIKIATDGFDKESRELLQELLLTNFGIKSKPQASGKLRFSTETLYKFFRVIKPYIHSSMLYKIP